MENKFLKKWFLIIITCLMNFSVNAQQFFITNNCTSQPNGATFTVNSNITVKYYASDFFPEGTIFQLQISEFSDMRDCITPETNVIGSSTNKGLISGYIPSNLPCKDYYYRINRSGNVNYDHYTLYSKICGPIHVTRCTDGTNIDNAIDLGVICSKTIDQVDNSQSKYSDNYSINKPHGQRSKDVWFKFKPQSTGLFQINTCGSCIDTYIHLLDENGKEIAYNDDQNGSSWMPSDCIGAYGVSMINSRNTGYLNGSLSLIENKTYYLVLEGYSNREGCINAKITCCIPCDSYGDGSSFDKAYDLCDIGCNVEITKDNGSSIYSNTYGTNMPNGQPSNDIWYTFTTTTSHGIFWLMTTCNSELSSIYIHLLRADKSEIISAADVRFCNSNNKNMSYIDGSNFHQNQILLDPGTYYVVVEGQNLTHGNITLFISFCPAYLPGER